VASDDGQTEYFSIAVDFGAVSDKESAPKVSLRDAAVDLGNHLATFGISVDGIGYSAANNQIMVRVKTEDDCSLVQRLLCHEDDSSPCVHMGYQIAFYVGCIIMPPTYCQVG